jgi:anion-transporting  ArsA/GET3 family ATPase
VTLDDLIAERRILVCCGSGGVGKTTTAAALAIRAATLGRRTLVLTIDPARRLANALGVADFGNEVRRVRARRFEAAGVPLRGELDAMMLDTKRTFDDLVERFAPSREMREAILSNPIYQELSDTLAGSREYMAMEKLYELSAEGGYDLIVLDTPPTKHALDFLDAPDRLLDFLGGKVVHLLLKPYLLAGRIGFEVFRWGASSVFSIVEKVTGMEFLRDLSDFILSFEGMYDGFKQRAARVKALLGEEETAFVLVTGPGKLVLEEAGYFYEQLVEHRMHVEAVIVNKVHLPVGSRMRGATGERAKDAEALLPEPRRRWLAEQMAEAAGEPALRPAAEKLLQNYARHLVLSEMDARNVRMLREPLREGAAFVQVPLLPSDVHDFDGLNRMNEHLFLGA